MSFCRLGITFTFLALFLGVGACKSGTPAERIQPAIGNGGSYSGGGDGSTQAEVEEAFEETDNDILLGLRAISNPGSLQFFPAEDCDTGDFWCKKFHGISIQKRDEAKRELLRIAPLMLSVMESGGFHFELVHAFPEISDSYGDPRDGIAATFEHFGAKILFNLPALKKKEPGELRQTIVENKIHEFAHQAFNLKDKAPFGVNFSHADGFQSFSKLVGLEFTYLVYKSLSRGRQDNNIPPREHRSTALLPVGLPEQKAKRAVFSFNFKNGIVATTVGTDDRPYQAYFDGLSWSAFSPISNDLTTATPGGTAFTLNGVTGYLVTYPVNGIIKLVWCTSPTSCELLQSVPSTIIDQPNVSAYFNGSPSIAAWIEPTYGQSIVTIFAVSVTGHLLGQSVVLTRQNLFGSWTTWTSELTFHGRPHFSASSGMILVHVKRGENVIWQRTGAFQSGTWYYYNFASLNQVSKFSTSNVLTSPTKFRTSFTNDDGDIFLSSDGPNATRWADATACQNLSTDTDPSTLVYNGQVLVFSTHKGIPYLTHCGAL